MMKQENYVFTDLKNKEDLIWEIQKLEEKIQQSIGEKVNLIAYSEKKEK